MRFRVFPGLVALVFLGASQVARAETTIDVDPGNGMTVTSADGDTKINIGFYLQFRFQELKQDQWQRTDLTQSFPPLSVENVGIKEPSFSVRRARLFAQGTLWKRWINYKLEFDLAGNDEGLRNVFIPPVFTSGGASDFPGVNIAAGASDQDGRTVKLLDAYADLTPKPYARVRIGQFKIPFGRQELVSDNRLQMTSRSIASDFFSPSRDRGVMFHGGTDTQRVQYKIGAFNGTGLAQSQNLDKTLGYAARLTATTSGPFLDVEDVIDQAPSLGVRVQGGIAWYSSTNTPVRLNPQIAVSDVRDSRYEADLGFFFAKRANLLLDYYARRYEVDQGFDLPTSCYGAFLQGRFSCDQTGYTIQSGVLLDKNASHELSLRYSNIDNDKDLKDDSRREYTLNYAYYFFKHTMQISASASYFDIGINAQGSSAFAVKLANPTVDFFDPAAYSPTMTNDKNWLGTIQFQWSF
jgi:hypothetical protein